MLMIPVSMNSYMYANSSTTKIFSTFFFTDIELKRSQGRVHSDDSVTIGQLTEKNSALLLRSLITAENLKLLEKIGQGISGWI